MNGSRNLLTWIIVIALVIGGIYWYRNKDVVAYKVVTTEKVTQEVQ